MIISDKKVGMGKYLPIPTQFIGKKISDKTNFLASDLEKWLNYLTVCDMIYKQVVFDKESSVKKVREEKNDEN